MPIRVKGPTADRHPRREWNSPERRRERQKEYMDKHGERPPRRKRLTPGTSVTQEHRKNLREKLKNLPKWKVQPKAVPAKKYAKGSSAKLTPAETRRKAGPSAAKPATKSIRDRLKDWKPREMPKFPKPESKVSPGRPGGKGPKPDKRWNKGDKFMTPLRAKKGIGGKIIQKIISKIKPKQKPKNVDKLLKNLGDEIKAAPLPPQLKKLVKEKRLSKAFPHHDSAGKLKKASGGRIGLKKGSVHKPGSHSWYLQHMTRPKRTKKAEGGRIGYYGGGRTRLLEELGRVEAEPSNRNRRAEISRVHGELNKGYKSGGAVLKGKKVGIQIK
jgi:hypothetical protein